MKVVILRGIPGSGKSTYAKTLLYHPTAYRVVCSADDFHTGEDGVYRFDPAKAGWAHGQCLLRYHDSFRAAFHLPTAVIVIDNTNTRAYEMAPYIALAASHEAFGVEYEIHYLPCDLEVACRRNVHAVPEGTIFEMHRALLTEQLPPFWIPKVKVVQRLSLPYASKYLSGQRGPT